MRGWGKSTAPSKKPRWPPWSVRAKTTLDFFAKGWHSTYRDKSSALGVTFSIGYANKDNFRCTYQGFYKLARVHSHIIKSILHPLHPPWQIPSNAIWSLMWMRSLVSEKIELRLKCAEPPTPTPHTHTHLGFTLKCSRLLKFTSEQLCVKTSTDASARNLLVFCSDKTIMESIDIESQSGLFKKDQLGSHSFQCISVLVGEPDAVHQRIRPRGNVSQCSAIDNSWATLRHLCTFRPWGTDSAGIKWQVALLCKTKLILYLMCCSLLTESQIQNRH